MHGYMHPVLNTGEAEETPFQQVQLVFLKPFRITRLLAVICQIALLRFFDGLVTIKLTLGVSQ